jgi:hypothetical protein
LVKKERLFVNRTGQAKARFTRDTILDFPNDLDYEARYKDYKVKIGHRQNATTAQKIQTFEKIILYF